MYAGARTNTARPSMVVWRAFIACLLLCLAAIAVPAPTQSHAAFGPRHDNVERSIVRKVNAIRAQHGLSRLRAARGLQRSADYHSQDMLRANFFAHTSSNGASFQERVESFRPSNRVGETLAYVPSGQGGAAQRIVNMWMDSAPHRASLLSGQFSRIGLARRKGALGSLKVVVYTADLASAR